MSEKRRRFRKNKDEKNPVVIARREDAAIAFNSQPKILLKSKVGEIEKGVVDTGSGQLNSERDDCTQCSLLSAANSNLFKDINDAMIGSKTSEPLSKITRPITLLSSSGAVNTNASKILLKNNRDFLVVGIIGAQGVGKSTILNLLANEDPCCDYLRKFFIEKDGEFPTKIKQAKWCCRPRTESTQMFITRDRMILIDSPPVLCNTYKKDLNGNNLEDIRSVITFLTICHLVIIVWDDYCNINFMRLLHFADLMKPMNENKLFVADYYPSILLLKNKAKRENFLSNSKKDMDIMLKAFFKDSRFQQNIDHKVRKSQILGNVPILHSFVFPDIKENGDASYRQSIRESIENLRSLVFMTPRVEMSNDSCEFTELLWFEVLIKASQEKQNFYFDMLESVYKKQYVTNNISADIESNESFDDWRKSDS